MRRAIVLALAAGLVLAPAAAGGDATVGRSGAVVAIGRDAIVETSVDRVVVIGGDLQLEPGADVESDVIVLFGDLRRAPDAIVGGSEYVVARSLIGWIPGPGWVAGLALVLAFLLYRAAVWAAVCAVAATLPRAATFERWTRGWEPRAGRALALGVVAIVVILPALGLLALSVAALPLALLGLAALLLASGAGLSMLREGPLWPHRPGRIAYCAYLLLPPALEIGLLITAAAGLGAGIRALTRGRSERGDARVS